MNYINTGSLQPAFPCGLEVYFTLGALFLLLGCMLGDSLPAANAHSRFIICR